MWPLSSASISAASSTSAPRAVLTKIAPGFMRAMRSCSRKPRVSSLSTRFSETTSAARQQRVDVDQRHAGVGARRAVPADHLHADALADARDLAADAAEADDAERLAEQLHAFVRRPGAAAHLAVHARDVARRGEHQRDRVLGDRGVAIALDGVHGDAALFQLGDVHVARRAGAEEHDVLELRALRDQRRSACRSGRRARSRSRRARAAGRRARTASVDVDRRIVGADDLAHTGASWSLQSMKMVFMAAPPPKHMRPSTVDGAGGDLHAPPALSRIERRMNDVVKRSASSAGRRSIRDRR